MSHPGIRSHRRPAFTLVELLVVIGIIAILIALLLPALQAARKQANTVRCAAHLREIGNCFFMYSHDSKGWFPPASWQARTGGERYNLNGVGNVSSWIWNSFLEKYATKNRQGTASTTNEEAADARKTIFWGCPEWIGYATSALGGFDRTGIGYGMNPYPTFAYNTPVVSPGAAVYNDDMPDLHVRALIRTSGAAGRFMKQNQWTRASERALVADSFNWRIKAQPAPPDGVYPGQPTPHASRTFSGYKRNQTMVDVYRHGSSPTERLDSDTYKPGGKVKYNILYADGHVTTHSTMHEAYHSIRFGNPGYPGAPLAPP